MKTITKLFFVLFMTSTSYLCFGQGWTASATSISNNPQSAEVGIGTVASTAAKLEIDVETSEALGAILRLDMDEVYWDFDIDGTQLNLIPESSGADFNIGTADLRQNSGRYHRWYNGATQNAFMGYSGNDLWLEVDELGGDIHLDAEDAIELQTNDIRRMTIDINGLTTMEKSSEALRLSGSSSYMTFYNGATYNGYLWHNNTNMYLNNNTATGHMYFGTGAGGTDMTIRSDGEVGIGTTVPEAELHIHKGAGTYTSALGSIATLAVEHSGFNTITMNGGNTWNGLVFADNTSEQYAGMYYNKSSDDIMFKCGGADHRMTITNEGDVGIGDASPDAKFEVAGGLILNEGTTTQVTGASATQLVERTDGAAMLFGAGNNAGFTIDENFDFQVRSRPRANVLARSLSGGLYLFVADGNNGNSAFGYSNALGVTHRVRVNGSIQATAFAPPSDRKLKKDVNPFEIGLDAVRKINPVTYVYNGVAGIECDATQVGMMAQDLQKLAPVLVQEETYYEKDEETGKTEAKDTYLSINDTGIKYILINAIKELATDVDAKDERIEALESELASMKDAIAQIQAQMATKPATTNVAPTLTERDVTLNGDMNVAALAQNHPNPFNENTTITYFLPEGSTGAHMNIFSAEGKVLKTVKIDETGNGQINLKANSLPAGNYMYQLVTDAGIVGSKSMVLAK